MPKRIIILSSLALLLLGLVVWFRYASVGSTLLWQVSDGGKWFLPLVLVSALIDSINPCAFSILLLTVSFLFSIGSMRSNILKVGLFYILGLFLVYILMGLGILQAMHFFNTPNFMARVGAIFLMALGAINLINDFFPNFPIKLRLPQVAHHKMAELMERASLPTAFLLGNLVGLCEFPCTGGPYLMILGFLHDKTTYLNGLGYLLIYNFIFILPLVVILLIASDKLLLDKVRLWQQQEKKTMRLVGGIAMVLLGVFIFFI